VRDENLNAEVVLDAPNRETPRADLDVFALANRVDALKQTRLTRETSQ
jgi:hypothetical protein